MNFSLQKDVASFDRRQPHAPCPDGGGEAASYIELTVDNYIKLLNQMIPHLVDNLQIDF